MSVLSFEFGRRDLWCGDETQDGDAGRWPEEAVVAGKGRR